MSSSGPRRTQRLLREALSYPAAERDAYFVRACGDDQELLSQVRALYEQWAAADPMTLPTAGGEMVHPGGVPIEGPGTRIGPYTLIENLGEGGFGVVYLAQQDEPVRRRVALKIIKLGMDTRAVIARFEAERQALAIMDHPGIAKVLDAGATDTGRPYFVMELVRGVPITRYCDQKQLPLKDRLKLFIETCRAVQHAHHKGVIHRDLKPGNILVTELDGVPVPKVIDFGVAKATSARLTERTLFTELKQIIGTPEYMSPEQAQEGGDDVDTRSDIYSLGVVLYELLTGVLPFEPGRLRSAAYAEIQRIIREEDPPTPSTRLSSVHDSLGLIAASRRMQPRRLGEAIRGELDWIVMKSMEKDRARRYDSAAAFAQDLERHLVDEPVSAGPPSPWYKMSKFVRRNRAGVAAAVVIALLVVGGSAAVVWTGWRAVRAEGLAQERLVQRSEALAEAEAQRRRAEVSLKRQEGVNKFFLQYITRAADPNASRGRDLTVTEVVDIVAANVHKLEDPVVQAAVRDHIASVYMATGRNEDAEAHLEGAERLMAGVDEDPNTLAARAAVRSEFLLRKGDAAGALGAIERAKHLIESAPGGSEISIATLALKEANVYHLLARPDRILAAVARGLAAIVDDPSDMTAVSVRAGLYRLKAVALLELGRADEALDAAESAVAEAERKSESTYLGSALMIRATCLAELGEFEAAIAQGREALRMSAAYTTPIHPSVAIAQHGLAAILLKAKELDDAAMMSHKSVRLFELIGEEDHAYVARFLLLRSQIHMSRGRLADARTDIDRAALVAEASDDADPSRKSIRLVQAVILAKEGDTAAAEAELAALLAEGDLPRRVQARGEATLAALRNGEELPMYASILPTDGGMSPGEPAPVILPTQLDR